MYKFLNENIIKSTTKLGNITSQIIILILNKNKTNKTNSFGRTYDRSYNIGFTVYRLLPDKHNYP